MFFVYAPPMHAIFGSTPLTAQTWGVIALASALIFALIEVEKFVRRRLGQSVF